MEVEFKVRRDMKKCKSCEHNPKNMKLWKRIKNLFESFPMCGLCTMQEIMRRFKK